MKSKICDSVCKRKYSFVLKGAGTSTEIGSKKYKILLDRVDVITAYQVYNQYNPKQNKERCVIDLAPIDLVDIFKRNCKFTPSIVLEDISFSPFYIGKITCACITDKEELCLIVDCNGFKSQSRFNDEMPVGDLKGVRIQIDSSSEQFNSTKKKGILKFSILNNEYIRGNLPIINTNKSFGSDTSEQTNTTLEGQKIIVTYEFSYTTISGNDGFSLLNFLEKDKPSLTILQFGGIPLSNEGSQFKAFKGNISDTDVPKILSRTSLESCFSGVTGNLGNISNWNTSNVTNMSNTFYGAVNFNQDISNWNTSNVMDMSGMFKQTFFKNDIGTWNTSNVMDMSGMFSNSQFNSDISLWNVSNVKDTSNMFSGAENFNQDISNWNTTNVTDMSTMFNASNDFNQDIDNWDTSNVKNMSFMFNFATSFNQDISNWNTSNVTNMSGMFRQTFFNNDIGNWNTSNVTDMSSMFNGSNDFNQDIGNWNTSNVTDMSSMFNGSNDFDQDIGNWNTGNVTDMSIMFNLATSFNQDLSGWCVTLIKSEPLDFSTGSKLTQENKPIWGTCPSNN
jgi:surface protein